MWSFLVDIGVNHIRVGFKIRLSTDDIRTGFITIRIFTESVEIAKTMKARKMLFHGINVPTRNTYAIIIDKRIRGRGTWLLRAQWKISGFLNFRKHNQTQYTTIARYCNRAQYCNYFTMLYNIGFFTTYWVLCAMMYQAPREEIARLSRKYRQLQCTDYPSRVNKLWCKVETI